MLWGKTITYLREKREIALQMTCGDVSDVEIIDGVFTARTTEEYIYNTISAKEAGGQIEKAFRFFGVNAKFEAILVPKPVDSVAKDIETLKKFCGNKLRIIK